VFHFCNRGFQCLARAEGDTDGAGQLALLAENRAQMARKWPAGVVDALSACIGRQNGRRIDDVDLGDNLACMLEMRRATATAREHR
jgi:hypothetical protein